MSKLFHRLRLRIKRRFYKTPATWPDFPVTNPPAPLVLWPDIRRFGIWSRQQTPEYLDHVVNELLNGHGAILNERVTLPHDADELAMFLLGKTPLFRENYGYLEFLEPLVAALSMSHPPDREQTLSPAVTMIEEQCRIFWSQPFCDRSWSTYAVSRRLLVYADLLTWFPSYSSAFQTELLSRCYEDACYHAGLLERDLGGNHLIKNHVSLLASTIVFEKLGLGQAALWWRLLEKNLNQIFADQLLEDGFHIEQTPMYHAWVLSDLLDVILLLKIHRPGFDRAKLSALARKMLAVDARIRHTSGDVPLFGDSSLPQTPSSDHLSGFAANVLGAGEPHEPPAVRPVKGAAFDAFPNGGYAVFRLADPQASLVFRFGNIGPRELPAHRHNDIGSFELEVERRKVIVDSGVNEYDAGLVRDYFRSTAAHNTLWVPGTDQAEMYGSFRTAEYPNHYRYDIEQDEAGAKVTVSYDNYSTRYTHQRTLYQAAVGKHPFWVIQDWITHLLPSDRPCYSLLHIHPKVQPRLIDNYFEVGENLLIIPFGFKTMTWADTSPWKNNLNLYSKGFNGARPGCLVASEPRLPDCFGWVLIPYVAGNRPECAKPGEAVRVGFPSGEQVLLSWDADGLNINLHE